MKRIMLLVVCVICIFSACNRNIGAELPTHEGWEVLLLENKRGSIVPNRVKLFFEKNQIPGDYTRQVLITAPFRMNQIGAAEWEIAREFAAYYGSNGVFLQSGTAVFNFQTRQDSISYFNRQRLNTSIDDQQANFFGIRY